MKENWKQLLPIIALGLVVLAIPLTVYLLQQRQVFRPKAAGEDVALSFSPSKVDKLPIGVEVKVDIVLNAKQTASISGFDVIVRFNPEVLEVKSFEPKSSLDTQLIPSSKNSGIDNLGGSLRYTAVDQSQDGISGVFPLGTITFITKAETTTPAQLTFEQAAIQIVSSGRSSALSVERGLADISILATSPLALNNVQCSFLPNGTGTQVILAGNNFGSRGSHSTVQINGQSADIVSWQDGVPPTVTPTSTVSATPADHVSLGDTSAVLAAATTVSSVTAKVGTVLEGPLSVVLATDNGQTANSSCTVGLTTAEFRVKTQCHSNYALPEADAVLIENIAGAKPILKKKVSIDASGYVVGVDAKLETGKNYLLSLSAPYYLSKIVQFTAAPGTTEISGLTLPIGDIYGQGSMPDNVVNSVDKAELVRQWNLVTDVSRSGDFNDDSRVNTIDYACMRANIGKVGDKLVY